MLLSYCISYHRVQAGGRVCQEEEIDDLKANIKELEKAKEDLEEQIRLNRLSELDDLITESGLSFEEVKELLNREQDE